MVLIYDNNRITIGGDTSIAWSEDVEKRFEAQNWNVIKINGHCYDDIEKALDEIKSATKPTIIIANTIIGKGAGELEGTHHTHGAPLGEEIIAESKAKRGFNPEAKFDIPEDVLLIFRCALEKGELAEKSGSTDKKKRRLSSRILLWKNYLTQIFQLSNSLNFQVKNIWQQEIPTVKYSMPSPLCSSFYRWFSGPCTFK